MTEQLTEQTTVRLYPLVAEHYLPMLVDFCAITVGIVVVAVVGMPNALAAVAVLGFAVLVHAVQMAWLVALRFDDTAITIVRPWRRRRIEWSRVAGLVYLADTDRTYRLRLVFESDELPPEADPDPAEPDVEEGEPDLVPIVVGPVLMAANIRELEPAPGTPRGRAARCLDQVFEELTRRGFPPPPPVAGAYEPAAPD
jgi:hypothetical protein